MYDGSQKIEYLSSNQELIEYLSNNEFNGSHVSQIVVGAEWEKKLNWIIENFNDFKNATGLSQSFTAGVLRTGDWLEKLNWLRYECEFDNYENNSKILRVLIKKNWINLI